MGHLGFSPERASDEYNKSSSADYSTATTTASSSTNYQFNAGSSDVVQPRAHKTTAANTNILTNNPAESERTGALDVFQQEGFESYPLSRPLNNTSNSLVNIGSMGGLNGYAMSLVDNIPYNPNSFQDATTLDSFSNYPHPSTFNTVSISSGDTGNSELNNYVMPENMRNTFSLEDTASMSNFTHLDNNMGARPNPNISDSSLSNGLSSQSQYGTNSNFIQSTSHIATSLSMAVATMATLAPAAASDSNTPNSAGPDVPAPFVRPVYVELEPNRIDPAGPVTHRDPNFRPIGSNNWTDILHDHSLLQYLSTSNIKEIKNHVTTLGESHGGNGAATLIGRGPYITEDAISVWKYCDAYMKRRGQERNNRAARRSRARKEAETMYWKQIALAAGAEDIDFDYDDTDPAYADRDEGVAEILPRETAKAIRRMKAKWSAPYPVSDGMHNQLPLPRPSPPRFNLAQPAGQIPPSTQNDLPSAISRKTAQQIQRQVYGQAAQGSQSRSLPARTRSQTRATSRRPVSVRRVPTAPALSPLTAMLALSPPYTSGGSTTTDQGRFEGSDQSVPNDGNVDWDSFMRDFS